MDAPRFSVGLPQSFDGGDPRPVGIYAARAETLGFSGLWTLDSAVGGPTSRTPLLDGLQLLAYAAAVTRDIRLGIAVIVMNRRQPVLLAKELASLDRLSGGRLTVGVGLGAGGVDAQRPRVAPVEAVRQADREAGRVHGPEPNGAGPGRPRRRGAGGGGRAQRWHRTRALDFKCT